MPLPAATNHQVGAIMLDCAKRPGIGLPRYNRPGKAGFTT